MAGTHRCWGGGRLGEYIPVSAPEGIMFGCGAPGPRLPSGPIPDSCLQTPQTRLSTLTAHTAPPAGGDKLHVYLRSYPYGYCCLWPICMLPMGPGGPLLYCSPIPLLGPGCMNCSPAGIREIFMFVFIQSPTELLQPSSLTLPHTTEGVLVGLVGTHPAHHLRAAHAGLVALRVGGHGVPS